MPPVTGASLHGQDFCQRRSRRIFHTVPSVGKVTLRASRPARRAGWWPQIGSGSGLCVAMGTNYEHLSCEERTMIQLSLEQRCKLRAIARSLQRATSSISRELRRNGWRNPATLPVKPGRPLLDGGYRAPLVQQHADTLAGTARCPARLAHDGPLWPQVECLLRARHSRTLGGRLESRVRAMRRPLARWLNEPRCS